MAKRITKGALEAQDPTPETTIAPDAAVAEKLTKRARKPKTAEPEAPPAPEPAPVGDAPAPASKKPKRAKGGATLADVFAGYVKDLEEQGKSDGTIASYRAELALAGDDLGLETLIADITPERVLLFMTSDRVMKKRSGRAKSPLSIDKTRRVLRQALVWAEGAKLVKTAPVPELAASH